MYSRICQHPSNREVHDDREGSIVCSECGLVKEDVKYVSEESPRDPYPPTPPSSQLPSSSDFSSSTTSIERDIRDYSDAYHIDRASVAKAAEFYSRTFSNHPSRQKNKTAIKNRLAFSLYYSLMKEGVPRTLEEIGIMFAASTKELWKLETQYCVDLPTTLPSHFLPRVADYFELDFSQKREIARRADDMAGRCCLSPKSLLAASIVMELQEEGKKGEEYRLLRAKVVQSLGLAPSTLTRCLKKLRVFP